jgi:hypothetical protein
MNESGDVTSHLMGFFYRTIRMVDHGIKPCYIFDGKPPELKGGVVSSFILLWFGWRLSCSWPNDLLDVKKQRKERRKLERLVTFLLIPFSSCILGLNRG